jgi:glycosyltransferase involved in cell wall biosynthesis
LRLAWARRADALIFYDPERPKWFIERGVSEDKVFVTWNSIDTDRVAEFVQDWDADPRHRVLYVGRLIASKKVDLLVRGFAEALPDLPDAVVLTIIGDGPERSALEALATEEGVGDRVEFTGPLTDETELAPYFNTSLVSVSPGYVGLSIIHSMAYGIPMLVADNEPHSPEIVALRPDANGVYFPASDPEALGEALVTMCRDTARLAQLSRAARTTVEQGFSLERMVQAFEDAVAHATRASKGRRQ